MEEEEFPMKDEGFGEDEDVEDIGQYSYDDLGAEDFSEDEELEIAEQLSSGEEEEDGDMMGGN